MSDLGMDTSRMYSSSAMVSWREVRPGLPATNVSSFSLAPCSDHLK